MMIMYNYTTLRLVDENATSFVPITFTNLQPDNGMVQGFLEPEKWGSIHQPSQGVRAL